MKDADLAKNAANFVPLTPLTFIERSATVYPDRLAVVHGAVRRNWRETYARCRRLASALAAAGVGRGDTVAVMLPNTPPMVEAHFGVPMAGAVLNTLNTRLDAAALAFMLDHGEAKVAAGRSRVRRRDARPRWRWPRSQPLVIDVDDAMYDGRGEPIGTIDYEAFLAQRRSRRSRGACPPTNGTRSA